MKGIRTALVAMAGGVVVCVLFFPIVGQAIGPLAPMLMDFAGGSVVATSSRLHPMGWLAGKRAGQGAVAAGILQLFIGYAVTYVFFQHVLQLCLHAGGIGACCGARSAGAVQLRPGLAVPRQRARGDVPDPWLRRVAADHESKSHEVAMLGIVWTRLILAIGGAMFYVGTVIFAMDPVIYLVSVPVPFLFGSVVVRNMLENSLFARLAQPARGVLTVLAAVGVGGALSLSSGW